MPYVDTNGARLYWESHGQGEPVLLIMGLTFTHQMWYRLSPLLASKRRVIQFDNRGVGLSGIPPGPYSIRQMAQDAEAVLGAAGEQSAHVIGVSMGGMIAQELAFRSPGAVKSLVLASTSYGGIFARWPRIVLGRRTGPFGLFPGRRERFMAQWLYSPTTSVERIEEDWAVQRQSGGTFRGSFNQLRGVLPWSSYRRLPTLRTPTVVVHGNLDRLIPPENGRTLARRIPGARFILIPNAGHILMTDQPEACEQLVEEFLEERGSLG